MDLITLLLFILMLCTPAIFFAVNGTKKTCNKCLEREDKCKCKNKNKSL